MKSGSLRNSPSRIPASSSTHYPNDNLIPLSPVPEGYYTTSVAWINNPNAWRCDVPGLSAPRDNSLGSSDPVDSIVSVAVTDLDAPVAPVPRLALASLTRGTNFADPIKFAAQDIEADGSRIPAPLAAKPTTAPLPVTESFFLSEYIKAINLEIDSYHKESLNDCKKAEDFKPRREEISEELAKVSNAPGSDNAKKTTFYTLLRDRQRLEDELNDLSRDQAAQSRRYFLDTILSIIRKSSILGVIATTVSMAIKSRALAPVLRLISTPITMGIFAFDAIENMIETWRDTRLNQRTTRYGTSLINLGIFGVGMAITAGAFVAAPLTLPLMLLGMMGVSYYKNTYIQKRLDAEIEDQEKKLNELQKDLNYGIELLIPLSEGILNLDAERQSISSNPKIQRLKYDICQCNINLLKLKFQREHVQSNRRGLSGMILGVGFIIAAILTAPIPPLSLALGIIGGFIIAGSATAYKSKLSQRNTDQLEQALTNQRTMEIETTIVNHKIKSVVDNCNEATHRRQIDRNRERVKAVSDPRVLAQRTENTHNGSDRDRAADEARVDNFLKTTPPNANTQRNGLPTSTTYTHAAPATLQQSEANDAPDYNQPASAQAAVVAPDANIAPTAAAVAAALAGFSSSGNPSALPASCTPPLSQHPAALHSRSATNTSEPSAQPSGTNSEPDDQTPLKQQTVDRKHCR